MGTPNTCSRVLGITLLSVFAGACVNELLIDPADRVVVVVDAGVDLQDAAPSPPNDAQQPEPEAGPETGPGADPEPERDAGVIQEAGPLEGGAGDAGIDAAQDAGPPLDAGDAGCTGKSCDAGTPPGPCALCDVVVQIRPVAVCDNGAPETCWTNPNGECSVQCPPTASCSAGDPNACAADEYCYFPRKDCGASSAGFCAKIPKECPSLEAPVCGCDGARYDNGCFANKARTAIADPDYATCN